MRPVWLAVSLVALAVALLVASIDPRPTATPPMLKLTIGQSCPAGDCPYTTFWQFVAAHRPTEYDPMGDWWKKH